MFWDRFKEQCDLHHVKPSQVVAEVEIPVGSITAWKKGTEPNTKALRRIADYCCVSIDYLLERSDPGMTEDERKLIEAYRSAPEDVKKMVLKLTE